MIYLDFDNWLEFNYDELHCRYYETGAYCDTFWDSFCNREYDHYLMSVI